MQNELNHPQEGICRISHGQWQELFEENKPKDKFFSKMNAGLKEDGCLDIMRAKFIDGKVAGVIATKQFKSYANLKWIVTVPEFRGCGVFRDLCEDAVQMAFQTQMKHFRVSINPPALNAYQKVGFKTWGVQQSGCFLSIGQVRGPKVSDLGWDWDSYVEKEVTKSGRGGCVIDNWKEAR
jgi:GNAT superfamily N-acetyltransferase